MSLANSLKMVGGADSGPTLSDSWQLVTAPSGSDSFYTTNDNEDTLLVVGSTSVLVSSFHSSTDYSSVSQSSVTGGGITGFGTSQFAYWKKFVNAAGTVVAVSSDGKVAYSTNGINFIIGTRATTSTVRGAGYVSGLGFVLAVGAGIYTTTDYNNWAYSSSARTALGSDINRMVCVNNTIVCSYRDKIVTSTNNSSWASVTSLNGLAGSIEFHVANNVCYVEAGADPDRGSVWRGSPDLQTWTKLPITWPSSIMGDTSTIYAYTSSPLSLSISTDNGVTWAARSYPNTGGTSAGAPIVHDGVFYAFRKGSGCWYTSDGVSWSFTSAFAGPIHVELGEYYNGKFYVPSSDTAIRIITNFNTGEFSDCFDLTGINITWAGRYLHSSAISSDGTKQVIAGGYSGLLTSSDSGANFTFEPSLFAAYRGVNSTGFVQYLNGEFIQHDGVNIYTSSDGHNWVHKGSCYRNVLGSMYNSRTIAYGNGVYVAVGYGSVYSSPDLINWTRVLTAEDGSMGYIGSVHFKYGKFIWYTSTGKVFISDDLINCTMIDISNILPPYTYAYLFDAGDFLFAATTSNIAYSNNGEDWIGITDDISSIFTDSIKSVIHFNDEYYIASTRKIIKNIT